LRKHVGVSGRPPIDQPELFPDAPDAL